MARKNQVYPNMVYRCAQWVEIGHSKNSARRCKNKIDLGDYLCKQHRAKANRTVAMIHRSVKP